MTTVPTPITDKNGKQTTVHKRSDAVSKNADNSARIASIVAGIKPVVYESEEPLTSIDSRAQAIELTEIPAEKFDDVFTPENIVENAANIFSFLKKNGAVDDDMSRKALFTYAAEKLDIDYDVLRNSWLRIDTDKA